MFSQCYHLFLPCGTCLSSERNWTESSDLFPLQCVPFCTLNNLKLLGLKPFSSCPRFHHLSSSQHCNIRQYSRAARSAATTWTHPAICRLPKATPPTLQQQKHANMRPHQRNTRRERNKSQANSLGDFFVVVVLYFLTAQQGYWLFAFLPESQQNALVASVCCWRASPCVW